MSKPANQATETTEQTADDIIALLSSQPDTFDVSLPSGVKITCRMPKSAADVVRIQRSASKFANVCRNRPNELWKEFLSPMPPDDVLSGAWWVSQLAVVPPFSELQALKLGATGGASLPMLASEIIGRVAGEKSLQAAEELEEAGEDFPLE